MRAANHAGQRVVGNVDGHLRRLGHAPVQPLQQRAAAGQHDALVHDVGHQLGRRLLDGVPDGVHDLLHRSLDGFAHLVGADLHGARQAGEEVAATQRHVLLVVLARVGRADRDLDVLRSALAEQ